MPSYVPQYIDIPQADFNYSNALTKRTPNTRVVLLYINASQTFVLVLSCYFYPFFLTDVAQKYLCLVRL